MNQSLHSKITLFLFCLIFLSPFQIVQAQQNPELPVYVVQTGDTLSSIAYTFGVTVNDLINVNNIENPNAISLGTEIRIPGLEGVSGKLVTQKIEIGDNLMNLGMKYNLSLDNVILLNRITSPNEIIAGMNLIAPEVENVSEHRFTQFQYNETKFDQAIKDSQNPWTNKIGSSKNTYKTLLPGDYYSVSKPDSELTPISPLVVNIEVDPLPPQQGKTIVITVTTKEPISIQGKLANYNLNFVNTGENEYSALQGIHAQEPGDVCDLTLLSQDLSQGMIYEYNQKLLLDKLIYGLTQDLLVDPTTIDPNITSAEDELITDITSQFTLTKYWAGIFRFPLDFPDKPECITATFGVPRSYNGGLYESFHSGIDILGCVNNNIYAAAAGNVVFTGPLTVRGNATIIDHGLGIFTGYWHQSEIIINKGQYVEAGQQIGVIGNTGRSNGAHLHWEVWVNGVQVDPYDWLEKSYFE